MQEKIEKLREKLTNELSKLEDGVHVKLDYDPRILELVLFSGRYKFILSIDENGNHSKEKYFALPLDILTKIDFSNVSFDNFNANDFDFTGLYGVYLNPQKLYKKSLFKTKLKGVNFIGPFADVALYYTDFTGSIGAKIDIQKLYHDMDEISLEGCTFTDVTFINKVSKHQEEYKIKSLDMVNFSGSVGAKIYIDNLADKSLEYAILKDATIIMPKKGKWISIEGTNFTGAHSMDILGNPCNIKINPRVTTKDFTNTIFDGVDFIEPLDDTIITNANFTGSHNAVINLSTIKRNSGYENTNFTDATVYGYNHERIIPTEDGRISTTLSSELDKLINPNEKNALLKQKDLEEARLKLIEANREKLKNKINELLRIVTSSENIGLDPANIYCKVPIEQELFLVQINDHYEINRNIIDLSLLRFFNLSMIDFTNVKVSGIDFRFSQARINPQLVYQKDISNCTFDNGNIKFFDDFTDVNIEGTNFDNCDFRPKVLKKV